METITESPVGGGSWSPARGRAAVLAVAATTFSVVTTEMLPVGLLSPLGDALGVSEGRAGLAVTLPGVVAALTAPLLPALAGRTDRRTLLVALVLLLAAADLASALAPGFGVLLGARLVVGVCIGGVWAVAAGLAPRLVRSEAVARSTAVIFSGIAVASVVGVPAGALAGELAGWRWGFGAVGVLALVVAGLLARLLPPLPPDRAARRSRAVDLLRVPAVRTGLALVLLLVTAHFAAYTYVRPVLERVAGVGPGAVSGLLLLYGAAGVAGNFLAGTVRGPRRALLLIAALLTLTLAALTVSSGSAIVSVALLALWGLAYGGVSVTTQTWLLRAAPTTPEAVSALFTAAFNAAIAAGAAVGGGVVDGVGVVGVLVVGAGVAGVGVVVCVRSPG
ncbi:MULTISPECIES: MFS transporter [unclassified Streptomyces]|uniref:MFS transporter n=1 Tax=Streptomyces sp. NBC_00060 TaxID=2975636 RepID=A0AAU2H4W5_9ACTN